MDAIAMNKITTAIIANFDWRSDRLLLLSIAMFVAGQKDGARTRDVVNEFYDGVEGCHPNAYGNAMSTMSRQLRKMEKAGILSKKLERSFIPGFSSRYARVGLGKSVKNSVARWHMKLDLAT